MSSFSIFSSNKTEKRRDGKKLHVREETRGKFSLKKRNRWKCGNNRGGYNRRVEEKGMKKDKHEGKEMIGDIYQGQQRYAGHLLL